MDKKEELAKNKGARILKEPIISFLDLTTILNNQNKIISLLENRLKYDETKEKAFNRLYDELNAIKYDKEYQKIKPLFLDLILLYDRITLLSFEDETLSSIQEELVEILSKQMVEIIEIENDIYDASLQKVVGTEIVQKELDSKVIKIVRDGFMFDNKIIRPQEVIIGKYIEADQKNDTGEVNEQ